VCPTHKITANSNGIIPTIKVEEVCFECGHCTGVCPKGAVSINGVDYEQLTPIQEELNVTTEQVSQFLKTRRATRNFKKTPVEHDLLQKILETSEYAPSGKNWALVNWVVIENTEEVQRISEKVASKFEKIGPVMFSVGRFINKDVRKMLSAYPEICKGMKKEFAGHVAARKEGRDTIFFNAPHLVIAYADTRNMVAHDACITALTQLELVAHSYCIGTCWSGLLGVYSQLTPSFAKELGIPKNNDIVGALMLGYPDVKYNTIPMREKPRVIWK
jgi:nitroreductase